MAGRTSKGSGPQPRQSLACPLLVAVLIVNEPPQPWHALVAGHIRLVTPAAG